MTKKRLFSAILLAALLSFFTTASPCTGWTAESADADKPLPTEMPGYSMEDLRKLAELVQRTGVDADRIPALDRPEYLSIADASLSLDDEDIVFIANFPGNLVRIYPRRILLWHEVVNDVLPDLQGNTPGPAAPGLPEAAGERYTISYSPLSGAVVAFRSMAGRYPTSFGVSGTLLNGNSVLYDRISRSLWSQLLAVSIEGPLRGKRLQRIPVLWATWGGVRKRYAGLNTRFTGKVEVLSRSTGFKRTYGKDPYGSYASPGNYYDDARLPFPVSFLDTRLPAKKAILGIEADSAFGAVQKDAVKEARVLNFSLGVVPMAAVYDQEIHAVRVFDRRLPGLDEPLSFVIFEDKLVDEQTRSEWTPEGKSVYGPLRDRTLVPVLAVDSMWFAWASLYRGSKIFPYKEF